MAEDSDLLKSVREGNPDALAAIFDRFAPAIYKYALRLCRDTVQADDVVGEVFSELIEQLKDGKGPRENLRSYLYQIAYHRVVDSSRQSSKSAPLDDWLPSDPAKGPSPQQEDRELVHSLETALQRDLNEEQRHIVVLRFIENLSLQETADITGKNIGNVKVIQSRAVAILRRTVAGKFQDNP